MPTEKEYKNQSKIFGEKVSPEVTGQKERSVG